MDPAEVEKVCWEHPLAFLRGPIQGWSDPRLVACLLLATVVILYCVNRYYST